MASYKNFSQKKNIERNWGYNNTDSAYSYDPIKQEKIEYGEWTKFLSYYRYYIDKFAVDILGINCVGISSDDMEYDSILLGNPVENIIFPYKDLKKEIYNLLIKEFSIEEVNKIMELNIKNKLFEEV